MLTSGRDCAVVEMRPEGRVERRQRLQGREAEGYLRHQSLRPKAQRVLTRGLQMERVHMLTYRFGDVRARGYVPTPGLAWRHRPSVMIRPPLARSGVMSPISSAPHSQPRPHTPLAAGRHKAGSVAMTHEGNLKTAEPT
jgi:hypothetical protein